MKDWETLQGSEGISISDKDILESYGSVFLKKPALILKNREI